MPSLKHVPFTTSKFALQVYAQVFNTLASHNIRFKTEFNYFDHHLYQKAPNTTERGLRADLFIEVDIEGREKSLIIVIEAEG
jgi:hypothetical protein